MRFLRIEVYGGLRTAFTYAHIASSSDRQARTAAPLTRTTSAYVLRKLLAMFEATALALAEEQIARTRLLYARLSSDPLLAMASFRSNANSSLRSQLQNSSIGFKSGDRRGTFQIFIFCLR